jgi:hypothetical protein
MNYFPVIPPLYLKVVDTYSGNDEDQHVNYLGRL